MSKRMIYAEDVLATIYRERAYMGDVGYIHARAAVNSAPTVEEKHGRWLTVEEGLFHGTREKCSLCGLQKNRGLVYHYCPNCGAKMDGGKKDGN